MADDKNVDESWKDSVAADKKKEAGQEAADTSDKTAGTPDINFLNYITSLGYQAMIFLGAVPNPITNQTEKDLRQAKLLIDTLIMIREKTKGNLDQQEESLLKSSVYELELKYVQEIQQAGGQAAPDAPAGGDQ